ncbi:unnamed protein product [Amoebophrya sp. A120]|nr:unnamed protein product [Amoebophrya sp. A120]|eukprot:GSA120T00017190001.1
MADVASPAAAEEVAIAIGYEYDDDDGNYSLDAGAGAQEEAYAADHDVDAQPTQVDINRLARLEREQREKLKILQNRIGLLRNQEQRCWKDISRTQKQAETQEIGEAVREERVTIAMQVHEDLVQLYESKKAKAAEVRADLAENKGVNKAVLLEEAAIIGMEVRDQKLRDEDELRMMKELEVEDKKAKAIFVQSERVERKERRELELHLLEEARRRDKEESYLSVLRDVEALNAEIEEAERLEQDALQRLQHSQSMRDNFLHQSSVSSETSKRSNVPPLSARINTARNQHRSTGATFGQPPHVPTSTSSRKSSFSFKSAVSGNATPVLNVNGTTVRKLQNGVATTLNARSRVGSAGSTGTSSSQQHLPPRLVQQQEQQMRKNYGYQQEQPLSEQHSLLSETSLLQTPRSTTSEHQHRTRQAGTRSGPPVQHVQAQPKPTPPHHQIVKTINQTRTSQNYSPNLVPKNSTPHNYVGSSPLSKANRMKEILQRERRASQSQHQGTTTSNSASKLGTTSTGSKRPSQTTSTSTTPRGKNSFRPPARSSYERTISQNRHLHQAFVASSSAAAGTSTTGRNHGGAGGAIKVRDHVATIPKLKISSEVASRSTSREQEVVQGRDFHETITGMSTTEFGKFTCTTTPRGGTTASASSSAAAPRPDDLYQQQDDQRVRAYPQKMLPTQGFVRGAKQSPRVTRNPSRNVEVEKVPFLEELGSHAGGQHSRSSTSEHPGDYSSAIRVKRQSQENHSKSSSGGALSFTTTSSKEHELMSHENNPEESTFLQVYHSPQDSVGEVVPDGQLVVQDGRGGLLGQHHQHVLEPVREVQTPDEENSCSMLEPQHKSSARGGFYSAGGQPNFSVQSAPDGVNIGTRPRLQINQPHIRDHLGGGAGGSGKSSTTGANKRLNAWGLTPKASSSSSGTCSDDNNQAFFLQDEKEQDQKYQKFSSHSYAEGVTNNSKYEYYNASPRTKIADVVKAFTEGRPIRRLLQQQSGENVVLGRGGEGEKKPPASSRRPLDDDVLLEAEVVPDEDDLLVSHDQEQLQKPAQRNSSLPGRGEINPSSTATCWDFLSPRQNLTPREVVKTSAGPTVTHCETSEEARPARATSSIGIASTTRPSRSGAAVLQSTQAYYKSLNLPNKSDQTTNHNSSSATTVANTEYDTSSSAENLLEGSGTGSGLAAKNKSQHTNLFPAPSYQAPPEPAREEIASPRRHVIGSTQTGAAFSTTSASAASAAPAGVAFLRNIFKCTSATSPQHDTSFSVGSHSAIDDDGNSHREPVTYAGKTWMMDESEDELGISDGS